MREIQVIFPDPATNQPPPPGLKAEDPFVQPMERGSSNEMVVWNFVSCNKDVKFVEIEFPAPRAKFFRKPGGGNTSNRYVKALGKGNRVQIYGHAPEYANRVNPVQDKYTIKGWKVDPLGKKGEGAEPVAILDPLFVTDKP